MNVDLKYWGRSGAAPTSGNSWVLSFSPNLARPKVFFDQGLKHPTRFREAISALHEVVVGDFRPQLKDRSRHNAWLAQQKHEESAIRRAHYDQAYQSELQKISKEPIPPDLEGRFRKMHSLYWSARRQWANELARNDPALFRALVPCDPVVTVAPDVVFFECFAKDESSYGCLFVDREAFEGAGEAGLGTTNVDYSLGLYDHFQTLRTYRPTRLQVDPTGFEVAVTGQAQYREEKIELPPSWLRGFGQLQGALGLPARTVTLSTDAVYSLLAFLHRHREKSGPRSIRFQLTPGKAPTMVLEPWNVPIESHGPAYQGPQPEEIRVWGRRRLGVLARLLPMAERVEVRLLGSGMPSIWSLHMGEMRFVLALSGWSANDWTSGASLELLAASLEPQDSVIRSLETLLQKDRLATAEKLSGELMVTRPVLVGSLHELAKQGQVVYDYARGLYRYRPVMPVILSESVIGQEPDEVREGKKLFANKAVRITKRETLDKSRVLVTADVVKVSCEGVFDADGGFSKARCACSHWFRFKLKRGPCRHLLALKLEVGTPSPPLGPVAAVKSWFN